jgi:hypothetical protein
MFGQGFLPQRSDQHEGRIGDADSAPRESGTGRYPGKTPAVVAEETPEPSDQGKEKEMMVELTCPHCSFQKSVPGEKIPFGARTAICPRCRQRFEIPRLAGEREKLEADKDKERTPPPWERRSDLGLVKGIRESLKGVLFSPSRFFRTTTVAGGIKEPLAFGVLMGSLGMMFEVFWQGLIRFGDLPSLSTGPLGDFAWGPLIMGTLVLCPLIATIFICISSLVLHLLLAVVRAGKNGFEATLRAVSYSQASQLWAVIPFLGSLLAGVWLMVVTVVSLREIHGISYARVIFALLIPFIVILVTVTAALISFFAVL